MTELLQWIWGYQHMPYRPCLLCLELNTICQSLKWWDHKIWSQGNSEWQRPKRRDFMTSSYPQLSHQWPKKRFFWSKRVRILIPWPYWSIFLNGAHLPYPLRTHWHLHMVAHFPESCNCETSPLNLCLRTMTNEWLRQGNCLPTASKM